MVGYEGSKVTPGILWEAELDLNQGAMPAQFIGSKLLAALHYSR
jgi:hypothetical protein